LRKKFRFDEGSKNPTFAGKWCELKIQ
jgi:hypothetical protein